MKEQEWTLIDKSAWGAGEWQHEPDKKQFVDPQTGLPCLIHRSFNSGALCGYVGVSRGHPLYQKQYGDADCHVEVHGGLTYSDKCTDGGTICHLVEPGEDDDVWWLGFDCAHAFDLMPARMSLINQMRNPFAPFGDHGDVYRNLAYVTGECLSLAAQLKAMES